LTDRPVAEVLNAWFESQQGEVIVTTNQGDPCYVRMEVGFLAEVHDPVFSITLQNETGHVVFATDTNVEGTATGNFDPGSTAMIRVRFDNWLAPGRYQLIASAARTGFGADVYDAHMSSSIMVMAERPGGGIADFPHTLEIERS
jgi:hypothetical protein